MLPSLGDICRLGRLIIKRNAVTSYALFRIPQTTSISVMTSYALLAVMDLRRATRLSNDVTTARRIPRFTSLTRSIFIYLLFFCSYYSTQKRAPVISCSGIRTPNVQKGVRRLYQLSHRHVRMQSVCPSTLLNTSKRVNQIQHVKAATC